MNIYERLQELCKQNGTSIAQLEKTLGFGNGSLKKSTNIPFSRVIALADYFGVSLDTFRPDYVVNGDDTSQQILIEAYKMPQDTQKRLLEYAKFINYELKKEEDNE